MVYVTHLCFSLTFYLKHNALAFFDQKQTQIILRMSSGTFLYYPTKSSQRVGPFGAVSSYLVSLFPGFVTDTSVFKVTFLAWSICAVPLIL